MASEREPELRHHPDFEPFLISGAETNGKVVGHGAYGTVVEVKVDGAVCAAKEIHQMLSQQGKSKVTDAFLRECKTMSALRHPNITQFLGFCFLDRNAPYPALVMERLAANLHNTLLNEDGSILHIPLGLKFSILCDVACGLAYLHRKKFIHRDLTATNVLLTTGMEAKIADLGMARQVEFRMTEAPGNAAYMPPEAMERNPTYSSSIDIFSWGVLTIFTLAQQFPEPLPATYQTWLGIKMRTELERREDYMQPIRLKYGSQGHPACPVIALIEACLHNNPHKRPSVNKVLEQATKFKESNLEKNATLTKLHFIQRITEMKRVINTQENELSRFEELKRKQENKISRLEEQTGTHEKEISRLKQMNEGLMKKVEELSSASGQRMRRSTFSVPSSQENEGSYPIQTRARQGSSSNTRLIFISTPHLKGMAPSAKEDRHKVSQSIMPLPLKWRQGKDAPFGTVSAQAVTIQQNLYIGGGHTIVNEEEKTVQIYNPMEDMWSLIECPTRLFSLCSDGENLFIGCGRENRLIYSMTKNGMWQHIGETLPPISEECMRSLTALLHHQNYFIIACGLDKENMAMRSVEICDTTTSTWHSAQPLPVAGHSMCSIMCGDTWYLSGVWEDMMPHIYKVSITSLIESATKGEVNKKSLWEEVPSPPSDRFHLLKFHNALTAVGGKNYTQDIYQYSEDTRTWFKVGMLPVGLDAPIAVELPHSGELFVACGSRKEKPYSESVWIGQVVD